jgi:hypothetical protein
MRPSPQNRSPIASSTLISERLICGASRLHLALLVILTGTIGTACGKDRLERASERLDISAIERYAKTLSKPVGSSVTIERCAMFSGTRAGYCLVGLSQATWQRWQQTYSLKPEPRELEFREHTCLSVQGFGRKQPATDNAPAPTFVPEIDVKRSVPKGKLPSNTNNVHWRAIWVGPAQNACLEFEYPYG